MTDRTHPGIALPLAAVAGRHRRRSVLLGALWGGAAGLGAAAAAVFAQMAPGAAATTGLAAAALAGLAVWRMTLGRLGGEMAVAARIDRAAALDQGFLTAVDLDRETAAPGPVGGVLLDRMDRAASGIDPARVLPLADRPVAAAAVALAIGAAALGATLLRAPAAPPAPPPAVAAEDPLDAARDAAERIAADAEALEDPYLEAVARALRDRLGAAEDGAESDTLEREIEELLEHAARAYGEDVPEWLQAPTDSRLADLGQRLDAFDEAQALEAARQAAEAEQRATQPPSMYDRDDMQDQNFADRDTDELIPGAGAQSGEADPDGGGEPPAGGADSGPRPMTPQELQFAGRIPVGAALESGKGESNEAGLGSETFEDDTGYADIETAQGDDVIVTTEPVEGGNRIRIEVAPETGDGAAAHGAAPGLAAGGGAGPAPADRVFVSPAQLALVARYLDRGGSE